MAGRSQAHMREYIHYNGDAFGNEKPRLVSNITNKTTGVSVNTATATSFDGYPRTYSATGLPTGTSINASTGVITGTATVGTYNSCVVTVVNAYGRVSSNTFTWTVSS